MFINYPNNPTAATAPDGFYREVVDFAMDNNIVVVSDNAYSEIAYDGYSAPSFLETGEQWKSVSRCIRFQRPII